MVWGTIGAAVAGFLFAGASASVIAFAGAVIGGALALGTQLAISYLTRPKKRTYSAVQGEREYGARVPVWALYGTGKVKGHHIYYAKWGNGNKFNADVFVLSNGRCDGLEPYVYFYGKKHNLVSRPTIGNEAAHYGVEGFDNDLTIRFYDGRPGQGVDTKLVDDTQGIGQRWKSTSVCAGLCYVVVERKYNEERFEKGIPDIDFILRGLRLYDPRKDSTVAGGSGSHRLNDPSTWEFSKNPAVQRLNYQLGLKGLISNRTLIGEGKSLGQLDLGSYFAAMNVCDTLREGKPTYESAIIVNGEDDHTEVLKEFDDAMAGYGMNRRGLSGVIAGAPQLPVFDLGPDDIDAGRPKQMKRRKSAFELYNHISGQFISPDANWNAESLTPVIVNQDVADDGRVRQTSNDFLQVTDPDIAQYLLQIRYRQNRKGGSATVPVSRRCGFAVTEGEWITYAGLTWLITGWQFDENLQFTLTLAETGADIYSSAGIEPGPIVVPPPAQVNPSELTTVANFNVEVGMVQGEEGFEVPSLRFTWTPPDDPTITAVRIFYGPVGGTETFEVQSTEPESGELVTAANVVSGKQYQARATITTVPDRFKTFTGWRTTLTVTGRTKVSVQLDGLSAGVKKTLQDLFAQHAFLTAALEQLALNAGEAAGTIAKESHVALRYRNATAAAMQAIRASIEEVEGQIIATAEAVTALQATVGDSGAGALWRMVVVAGEGEVVSRIELQVRATVGDDWVAASTVWEAGFDSEDNAFGRIVLSAAQTMIADGEGNVVALFDEDGVHFSNAFIGQLTGDHIAVNTLTGNHIEVGSIDSPSLAFGAVTELHNLDYTRNRSGNFDDGSFKEVASWTIENPEGTPFFEYIELSVRVSQSGGNGTADGYIMMFRNGLLIPNTDIRRLSTNGNNNGTTTFQVLALKNAGETEVEYTLEEWNTTSQSGGANSNLTITCNSIVMFWKR